MVTHAGKPQKTIFFSGDKPLTFQLLASDSQSLIDGLYELCYIFRTEIFEIIDCILCNSGGGECDVKAYILEYTFVLMGKAY